MSSSPTKSPYGESEMERIAREAREFREQEAKRIAAEKEAARLAYEKHKKEEIDQIAIQSSLSLESAALEREELKKTRSPPKQEIHLEDAHVSEKAKRLREKEDLERRRLEEKRRLIEGKKKSPGLKQKCGELLHSESGQKADEILSKRQTEPRASVSQSLAEKHNNESHETVVKMPFEPESSSDSASKDTGTSQLQSAGEKVQPGHGAETQSAEPPGRPTSFEQPEPLQVTDQAVTEHSTGIAKIIGGDGQAELIDQSSNIVVSQGQEEESPVGVVTQMTEGTRRYLGEVKSAVVRSQYGKLGNTAKIGDGPSNFSRSVDEPYVRSLVLQNADQSLSRRVSKKKESPEDDDLGMHSRVQEASFEIPLEYTGRGVELWRDAELSFSTSMAPSRVNGKWSGSIQGNSTIGSSNSAAVGSLSLNYHPSTWNMLSFGVIRGHELHHPLITLGGSLARKGSALGVTFYHNALFLHSILLKHSMYSLFFRHRFHDSKWKFVTELSRRQDLSLSLSNTKISGICEFSLRNRNHINARVDVRPRISEHRRAHLYCQWKSGVWKFGASLIQSLHSELATVGLGVRLFSSRGLEWVLSWNRGDASVTIPIIITQGLQNVNLGQALYFSMLSFLVQEGLADMWGWNEPKSAEDSAELVSLHLLPKARHDAEMQRDLMARQAKRRRKEEADKEGLVIHMATYQIKGGDKWEASIPLQFWVNQSSLRLPATSKAQLLGFYDIRASVQSTDPNSENRTVAGVKIQASQPWWVEVCKDLLEWNSKSCTNENSSSVPMPTLTVRYDFKGQPYLMKVKDDEELILPNPLALRLRR